MFRWLLGKTLTVSVALAGCAQTFAAPPDAGSDELFEKHIRPLLVTKCYECHSADALKRDKLKGGLRVDTREGLRRGGESGPGIVPGDPKKGTLLSAIRYEDFEMPPSGKLRAEEIALIEKWIREGAHDPRDGVVADAEPKPIDFAAGRKHWAYQPVRMPAVPKVQDTAWPKGDIDRFILARLEEAGIDPSPAANKRTWIRRVTFDLIGLPPTYEQVQAFVNDRSDNAGAKVVDRLLASPHYGERWARHWLDVARYADSRGYVGVGVETRYPFAYTYRDYVVRSLNKDKPYDRFVLEQLAADQLDIDEDKSQLAALGFLTIGHRFNRRHHLFVDDQIDVVTRGLLGLTATCARCHDHKYDAISADDYYGLYGIFDSCREPGRQPIIGKIEKTPEYRAYTAKLEKLRADVSAFEQRCSDEIAEELRGQVDRYLVHIAAKMPSGSTEAIPEHLRVGETRGSIVARWRGYLGASRARRDPLFAPWHALVRLPRDGFAAKAKQLISNWQRQKPTEPDATKVNPRILAALAESPPTNAVDVAMVYAKLIGSVDKQWRSIRVKEKPTPQSMKDVHAEQIRALLYNPLTPCVIPSAEVRGYLNAKQQSERRRLANFVTRHEIGSPHAPSRAMALVDREKPVEPRIFIRGNPKSLGRVVPRRYLRVLSAKQGHERFRNGSGRLELARAIASPDNPLTARVIVNRVWQHHFGQGLVRTPSDFGTRGEPPTHPRLLDYLAASFVEDKWSLKGLHRRIVLSGTYGQSSAVRSDVVDKDSENLLWWRYPRQRLAFEPLRDSILAVSGKLDRKIGGRPVDIFKATSSRRRSLYATVRREEIPMLLRHFDVANPNISTASRTKTTVPQQSLFLMNSAFAIEQAQHLAARAAAAARSDDDAKWVQALYRITLSRDLEPSESAVCSEFLKSEAANNKKSALSPREKLAHTLLLTNEFMFVD